MLPSSSAKHAPIYRFLARLVLTEIDEALIAAIATPAVLSLLAPLAPGLREYVRHYDSEAHEAAAEEFTRLFVLPSGVSPRAARWIEGELATVGALLSQRAHHHLLQLGREIDSTVAGKLPLDHVGLLLDLAAASMGGPTEQVVLRELVLPWAERFGAALCQQANSPVYIAAGALLQHLPTRTLPLAT